MRYWLLMFCMLCCLAACSSNSFAPVWDASSIEHIPKSGLYRVMPGDTVYSIAWRYGLDYRYLARINHLSVSYAIESGQVLYLRPRAYMPSHKITESARKSQLSVNTAPVVVLKPTPVIMHDTNAPVTYWRWPARGPVVAGYSSLNKGINIGGHLYDSIRATAPGVVVYCGNGLRGYGNLIIIKHNNTFLTAYAYNSTVLVNQGDWVKRGQRIAEMGAPQGRRAMLHFEIRRDGQPVNPLIYLQS